MAARQYLSFIYHFSIKLVDVQAFDIWADIVGFESSEI